MRYEDIIAEAPIKRRQLKSAMSNTIENPPTKGKVLGMGADSVVFKTANPKIVNKIANTAMNQDGYLQYILQTTKLRKQGNPYVPMVHGTLKHFTDNTGAGVTKFQLERLYPLRSGTPADLAAIYKRITGKIAAAGVDDIIDALVAVIDKRAKTPDIQLEAALKIIRRIHLQGLDYPGGTISHDIREPNLMLRKTANGAQLVLADPISGNIGIKN